MTGSATTQSTARNGRFIEPDQCDLACPVPLAKRFRFALGPNQIYIPRRPASQRGVSRSSRTLGAGCGGRGRRCRRAVLTRTAKSCGPDAPTLASSLRRRLRRRRWQTSPVTGESTKETVKTIAQGMPGDSGVTVVTNSRVYYTTRAAAGASGARHSLRPLIGGRKVPGKTRAKCAARSRSCVSEQCCCLKFESP
jgi:hypothetical protein